MKAWQRLIREQHENLPDLFIDDKQRLASEISASTIRPISYSTASEFILDYEWLKCMPAICWHQYGIFFGPYLAGVVVYGVEYGENLGVWDRFGFKGKIILLSRGACVHWAHPHSGSKLIRASMKLLPERFKVITATVDPLAGEIGTLYQACGFDYVGVMREAAERKGWLVDGRIVGSRFIRRVCGSSVIEVVRQKFPNAEVVMQRSKGRYFAFRGTKQEQRELRAAISSLFKPYPKRDRIHNTDVTCELRDRNRPLEQSGEG